MKKGFTLIELLGVIIVLSIIALIVTPIVQSTIKSNKASMCNNQIKSYERAAKNYTSSSIFKYDCGGSTSKEYEITLSELMENGYIEDNVTNPRGGTFAGHVKLTVKCTGDNYKYSYKYVPSAGERRCEG